VPSERETRALTLEDVEGLKQWFYAMEDVVAEFDMLTKLLRLKFEQKYESASLEWIDELVTAIREIVAPNEVWASIHQDDLSSNDGQCFKGTPHDSRRRIRR
jgi:hypothetical protein